MRVETQCKKIVNDSQTSMSMIEHVRVETHSPPVIMPFGKTGKPPFRLRGERGERGERPVSPQRRPVPTPGQRLQGQSHSNWGPIWGSGLRHLWDAIIINNGPIDTSICSSLIWLKKGTCDNEPPDFE